MNGRVRDAAALVKVTGTLSYPSKMPGTSYSLPASACVAGAALAKVEGTVCASCYALHGGGSYSRRNVVVAQARRLASLVSPFWVRAMTALLNHVHSQSLIRVDLGRGVPRFRYNEAGWHRWHDSGDLQSVDHLRKICEVAAGTPTIRHWLPTQELGMVKRYLAAGGTIPDNLVVRVSSVLIDDETRRSWPHTASVFTESPPAGAHVCPAPTQDHRCGACRACWSSDTQHIAYALH